MPTKFFDRFTIPVFAVTALLGAFLLYSSPTDILDTKLYYSPEFAQGFFQHISAAKSELYFITAYIDLIFLFCYTFSFELSFQRLFPTQPKLLFLARAAGAFDLIETLGIIYGLSNPQDIGSVAYIGLATLAKWLLVNACLLIISFGAFKHLQRKGNAP